MKRIITMLILSMFVSTLSGQTSSVSKTNSSKTSISVSKGDNKYFYTSHFDFVKTAAARAIIVKNLGRPKEDNGQIALWEENGYSVSVRQGKVQIEVYFEKVDNSLISKIEKMADEISGTISAQ